MSSYIGSDWNKRARYSIGDEVIVGTNKYKSVEPNNIGIIHIILGIGLKLVKI